MHETIWLLNQNNWLQLLYHYFRNVPVLPFGSPTIVKTSAYQTLNFGMRKMQRRKLKLRLPLLQWIHTYSTQNLFIYGCSMYVRTYKNTFALLDLPLWLMLHPKARLVGWGRIYFSGLSSRILWRWFILILQVHCKLPFLSKKWPYHITSRLLTIKLCLYRDFKSSFRCLRYQ